MAERPTMLSARRRAAGTLPGMAPATAPPASTETTTGEDPPPGTAGANGAGPRNPKRRARRRPLGEDREGGLSDSGAARRTLSFGGTQKVSVSTRSYRALWDAYARLASDLEAEGRGRVFHNDLMNAVLAVYMPANVDEGREVLARYWAILEADPPRDLPNTR